MKESVDIFLSRLYTSNDPLCLEAAVLLEKNYKKLRAVEEQNYTIALASKYMVESLFDIMELAKSRDKKIKKDKELVAELNLRLKECANIASDTLKLETVCKAFEKMKD